MTDPPPAAPRYLGGRYRLDRIIGRGSMGRVWAAFDEWLTRWVAIKEVVFPQQTPGSERDQITERAMREARAIASVTDPHVVTIFDLVATGGTPAIVMELLDSKSMSQILGSEKTLDEAATAAIGFGAASALVAAHQVGITHRDVKPGNVLLCKDGRVKLTDFGIARSIAETTMTATGLLLGSPAYISPEVAAGEVATPASDAWGLGALLYAGITGDPPFDAGDPLKTLYAVVHDPVPTPPPSAGRISGLITGLMVKDPKRRMTTAQAQMVLRDMADEAAGQRLAARLWSPTPTGPQPTPRAPARTGSSSAVPSRSTAQPTQSGQTTAGAGSRPATGGHPAGPRNAALAHAAPTHATSRPFVSLAGPATGTMRPTEALPPPPWAAQGSATLKPLPHQQSAASAARTRAASMTPARWAVVALIAVLAAVLAFFAVRGVHDIITEPADTGSISLPR